MKEFNPEVGLKLLGIVAIIVLLLILSQLGQNQDELIIARGIAAANMIDAFARSSAVIAMSCIGSVAALVGLFLSVWLIVNRDNK